MERCDLLLGVKGNNIFFIGKKTFEFRLKYIGLKFIEIQNVAITLNLAIFDRSQRMGYTEKSR